MTDSSKFREEMKKIKESGTPLSHPGSPYMTLLLDVLTALEEKDKEIVRCRDGWNLDWKKVGELKDEIERKDKEIARLKERCRMDEISLHNRVPKHEVDALRAEVEAWKQKADEFQTKGGVLAYEKEDLEKEVERLKKELTIYNAPCLGIEEINKG